MLGIFVNSDEEFTRRLFDEEALKTSEKALKVCHNCAFVFKKRDAQWLYAATE